MPLYAWIGVSTGIAVFFILLALFWLVRSLLRQREEQFRRRLGVQEPDNEPNIRIRKKSGSGIRLSRAPSMLHRLRLTLNQGGIAMSSGRFLGLSLLAVLTVLLLATLATSSLLSGLVLAALAIFCIYALVMRRCQQRLRQVRAQLPVALEVMTFSLRAGHSLEEAIRMAAEEVEPPLSVELLRCHEEYALGRPIEVALRALRARFSAVRPLHAFVEAVVVLKRTGGNIIEVMETIVDNLRSQTAYEAKHRALTSEGRMSGLFLMALPLVTLAIQALSAPDQLELMVQGANGRFILLIAALLWVVGVVWIRRLVRPRLGR
jgi:tight adherence protein B